MTGASTVTAANGTVSVTSTGDLVANAKSAGGSGAILVSGSTASSTADISRDTQAAVQDGAKVTAGALNVTAELLHGNATASTEIGTFAVAGAGSGVTCTDQDSHAKHCTAWNRPRRSRATSRRGSARRTA